MSRYLLIESRDPYEAVAVKGHFDWGVQLRRAGHEVLVFLVQNGVLPVRAGASSEEIQEALGAGIEIFADEFSLRERGIALADVSKGVKVAPIDLVVERLAGDWKALFC